MKTGEIVNNKYEIVSLIGKGGMSEVYLARDIQLKKEWAIKKIEKNYRNSIAYESMLMEAKMISSLSHHSIPRIVDIIETKSNCIIIMDYIQGNSLDKIIRDMQRLPESMVIDIAMQLINAFEYIHSRNIIYRDLKPDNIMLQPNGEIKLIDFGVARTYEPEKLSDTVCLGTVGYAAPEQYGGKGQTDYRVDVYAFGVTLFYMLTGINPTLSSLDLSVVKKMNLKYSLFFERVIEKCVQPEPNKRYQSFFEIRQVFEDKDAFNVFSVRVFTNKIFKKKTKELLVENHIHNFSIKPKQPIVNANVLLEVPPLPTFNETTILSTEDLEYNVPSSVLDNQKVSVFLSYCHCDDDLADIICKKLSKYPYISVSRYTTDVPYKKRFKEFMNSLKEHDKVIMIISDQYLKSHACMYEVGQLMNSPNFESKILFIVCSERDKKYYKVPPEENIEAKLYNVHDRNQYILFWQSQCKVLEEDMIKLEDERARLETLNAINDIKHLIRDDIGVFMKYIAEVNGVTFDELYQHGFAEFLKELEVSGDY